MNKRKLQIPSSNIQEQSMSLTSARRNDCAFTVGTKASATHRAQKNLVLKILSEMMAPLDAIEPPGSSLCRSARQTDSLPRDFRFAQGHRETPERGR
jgi:hypothetical protein